jgi:hypothetical protein
MNAISTAIKLLVVVVFAVVAACSGGIDVPAVQDGDIIFQTSMSSQSVAIQRATGPQFWPHGDRVLPRWISRCARSLGNLVVYAAR